MSDLLFYAPILTISFFVFLYSFWKNLKDDYIPSQIFSTAFFTIFLFALGLSLGSYFKIYPFWLSVLGLVIGYTIGTARKGIKFYDTFDSVVISSMTSAVFSIPLLIIFPNAGAVIFYTILLFSILVFFLIKKHYKGFIWYRSGRRGFAGLFTFGTFFLLRSIISLIDPGLTIDATIYDVFISGLISFVSLLNIFVLARR